MFKESNQLNIDKPKPHFFKFRPNDLKIPDYANYWNFLLGNAYNMLICSLAHRHVNWILDDFNKKLRRETKDVNIMNNQSKFYLKNDVEDESSLSEDQVEFNEDDDLEDLEKKKN